MKKKRTKKKNVVSIGKMTRLTHLRAMILIPPMKVIIDIRDTKKETSEKDPIRICATLTGKLLTTAYKSKIIRFKMDEDPLQCQIYFLTFIDSLDMILSQYRETCEVFLDYPKIGGGDVIEDYAKNTIRKLFYSNIDVHSNLRT